jgi:hypothetical protein
MIDRVLNDAWRTQSASNACLHDSLVEERIGRPMKPNKGRIAEVAQAKPLESGYRVTLGRSEHDPVLCDKHLSKILVRLGQREDESRIQPAGPNGFDLFDRPQGL